MSIIGNEVPVARDLLVSPRSTVASFGISNTGTLAYLSGTPQTNRLVLVDWNGQETPLPVVPAHGYAFPRFSPAGDQLAVNVYEGGFVSAAILDPRTGRLNRIATEGNNIWPFWTPGGKRLTFQSDRDGAGQWKVLWQPADGSGPAESILQKGKLEKGYFDPRSWSPDGILVGEWHPTLVAPAPVSGNSLAALETGDRPELVTVVPPDQVLEIHGTALSRDGRWVAYAVDERGQAVNSQVYVTAFPKGGKKWLISKGKGWKPLWSPDGRHIFYSRPEGDGSQTMMMVDIAIEPEFLASEPHPLFRIPVDRYDPGDYYTHPGWDISPDGKHFVMVKWDENWREPRHINITSNFFEELRRLCPTGEK
jgi:Tol biopolymer transport system component